MQEKAEGRRVKMTKMLIKKSLIEIMKKKSIHTISIKEICEGADINRSTFYRHYNTQYELYDDIINDLASNIISVFDQSRSTSDSTPDILANILTYIENHRETFLVILSDKSNVSLGEAYSGIVQRFIDKKSTSEFGVYIAQFVAAGMTSFLWTWLSKEKRRPPKEVAALIYTLMMHGLRRAIDFSDTPGTYEEL